MSIDVKISNQWFASLESCVKRKLWLLCALLLFVEGAVLLSVKESVPQ
jgi:hypothetical protein